MIACLGWGSLIWDPRNLNSNANWREDGPLVPIEFTRQSANGRLTLVIEPTALPLRVLWTTMATNSLESAINNLSKRENTTRKYIGSWQQAAPSPDQIPDLAHWASLKGLDAVIWTALPPSFNNKDGVSPSVQEAIQYLKTLDMKTSELAE